MKKLYITPDKFENGDIVVTNGCDLTTILMNYGEEGYILSLYNPRWIEEKIEEVPATWFPNYHYTVIRMKG